VVAQGATHEEDNFNLNGNDGMMPINLVITWSIVVKKRGRIQKIVQKKMMTKDGLLLGFFNHLIYEQTFRMPKFFTFNKSHLYPIGRFLPNS
jgi:hypothetical protein